MWNTNTINTINIIVEYAIALNWKYKPVTNEKQLMIKSFPVFAIVLLKYDQEVEIIVGNSTIMATFVFGIATRICVRLQINYTLKSNHHLSKKPLVVEDGLTLNREFKLVKKKIIKKLFEVTRKLQLIPFVEVVFVALFW